MGSQDNLYPLTSPRYTIVLVLWGSSAKLRSRAATAPTWFSRNMRATPRLKCARGKYGCSCAHKQRVNGGDSRYACIDFQGMLVVVRALLQHLSSRYLVGQRCRRRKTHYWRFLSSHLVLSLSLSHSPPNQLIKISCCFLDSSSRGCPLLPPPAFALPTWLVSPRWLSSGAPLRD